MVAWSVLWLGYAWGYLSLHLSTESVGARANFPSRHLRVVLFGSVDSNLDDRPLHLCLVCARSDNFFVVTDRWQKFTSLALSAETLKDLAQHCVEFLVHAVDVEGKQSGIEEDLVKMLGEWSPIPVTYAGGARSLEDLELVNRLGGGKVDLAIGSALDIFGGKLAYSSVVEWSRARYGA